MSHKGGGSEQVGGDGAADGFTNGLVELFFLFFFIGAAKD